MRDLRVRNCEYSEDIAWGGGDERGDLRLDLEDIMVWLSYLIYLLYTCCWFFRGGYLGKDWFSDRMSLKAVGMIERNGTFIIIEISLEYEVVVQSDLEPEYGCRIFFYLF